MSCLCTQSGWSESSGPRTGDPQSSEFYAISWRRLGAEVQECNQGALCPRCEKAVASKVLVAKGSCESVSPCVDRLLPFGATSRGWRWCLTLDLRESEGIDMQGMRRGRSEVLQEGSQTTSKASESDGNVVGSKVARSAKKGLQLLLGGGAACEDHIGRSISFRKAGEQTLTHSLTRSDEQILTWASMGTRSLQQLGSWCNRIGLLALPPPTVQGWRASRRSKEHLTTRARQPRPAAHTCSLAPNTLIAQGFIQHVRKAPRNSRPKPRRCRVTLVRTLCSP